MWIGLVGLSTGLSVRGVVLRRRLMSWVGRVRCSLGARRSGWLLVFLLLSLPIGLLTVFNLCGMSRRNLFLRRVLIRAAIL